MSTDLPEGQTAALAAKARSGGLSTEEYAREVLMHDLAPDWVRVSWTSAKAAGIDRLSMEEIDAEIAAARRNRREPPATAGFMIRVVIDTNILVFTLLRAGSCEVCAECAEVSGPQVSARRETIAASLRAIW